MIASLLPWLVVLVAAGAVVQLGVTAHRAGRPGAAGSRSRLLTRAVGCLTFVLLALALGPWGPLTRPLWGVLFAGWAWGALTAATAWRSLPPLRGSGSAPGRSRTAAASLVAEAGLLLAVIAFVVV